MAKNNKSIGGKLKDIAVGTVKGTAKDLLTLGTIVGPGKAAKAATTAGTTAFKVAEKVANTKAGVAATKAVAKQIAKKDIKNTKKAVNAVADMQAKTKAEKIAKNSVKVVKATSKAERDFKNKGADLAVKAAKSGSDAKFGQSVQKVTKPAKVVKINSAPKKTGK